MTPLEPSIGSMSLLSMDITAAMNFLPCQAGSNTFATLPSLSSPKSSWFKPLPVLPIHDPETKDQLHLPRSSISRIQIQNSRPERTLQDRNVSLSIRTNSMSNANQAPLASIESNAADEMPMSPTDSQLTRGSSIYSTESAHSSDSLETSITQIVEMYTDLINKIPTDDTVEGLQILQPRAYRDTLTPLLHRRFSDDDSPASASPQQSISALHVKKDLSSTGLTSDPKQAPPFSDFSRNLKDKRAELVSPLSASSTYYNQMTLDSLSELSPMSTRDRQFSFSSEVTDSTSMAQDYRPVSPLHSDVKTTRPDNPTQAITQNMLDQVEVRRTQQYAPTQLQFVRPQDIYDKRNLQSPDSVQEPRQSLQNRPESTRFYQSHPARQDRGEDLTIYNGVSDTAKAMIKDKISRREAKERNDIIRTAKQKYPGMDVEIQEQRPPLRQKQDVRNKGNNSSLISQKSMNESVTNNVPSPQPRRVEKSPAIPLTPYQMYGTDAWKAENKLKKKEEPRQNKSQPELRPKSSDNYQQRHARTSSSKSSESVDSNGFREKKNSFIAALGGAKMSFTSSSADKRREKLKDSIVIVGTTHLSVDHALGSGKSLP